MTPKPLPPLVDGPITTASQFVLVDNLLPNSKVIVYEGTTQIGTGNSGTLSWMLVSVTGPLHAGQKITATQEYTGSNPNISASGASDHSNSVPVLDTPNPMPEPAFASGLTTCAGAIYLGNLIPGAKVTVKQGGTTVVHDVLVTLTTQAFALTGALATGSVTATQSAGGHTSSPVTSLPVETAPRTLSAPVVAEPLYACQTGVQISGLTPTAGCELINGSVTDSFTAAWSDMNLDDMPPLTAGTLTARQKYERCDSPAGPVATFNVTNQPLPLPVVSYKPCADVRQMVISQLVQGSILTLYRVVTPSSGTPVKTSLGSQGVSEKTVTVNLPASFSATDPGGAVSLEVAVSLCSQTPPSPGYTKVTFATPGSAGHPELRAPLYACGKFVVVTGVHPGSEVQVFSGSTSVPRSAPVVATVSEIVIELWTPLVTGESIFAAQSGCSANGQTNKVTVQLGKPGQPVIQTPVRPGAATIEVSNLLPGAAVYLLVNGSTRTETVALAATAEIAAGSPALANNDTLEVVQQICTLTGAPAKAQVAIGNLHLTVTPNQLTEGTQVEFLVIATDTVSGAQVAGLPVLAAKNFDAIGNPVGPSSSGVTGSSFAYTPAVGDTTAYIWVNAGPGYINVDYGPIAVTVPPPLTPIDLSPTGNIVQPVTLHWVDPGAGTSRAAEYFSITFNQDGHLSAPTPLAAVIASGTSHTFSGIAGGQGQWRISAGNPGGTSGVASADINVITGPGISVARVSGNKFQVTGSGFSAGGGVSLSVTTAIAGGTPPINANTPANSAGGFSVDINCAATCQSAGGGGLVFVATDNETNTQSNTVDEQCS